MHTFNYITNAVLKNKIENETFEHEHFRQHTANADNQYSITRIINNKTFPSSFLFLSLFSPYQVYNPRYKMSHFKNTLTNPFITDLIRDDFIQVFTKIQKTYHVLNLFAFRYRSKKSVLQVKKDVFLNPIELGSPRVICIFQNNSRYLFTCSDLVNIINTSLGNNIELFADPLTIKNPYSNIPFNKSILYTIYFFMKNQAFIIPELFHAFFLCNFNLSEFSINNEVILREYAINEFFNKSSTNLMYREIKLMLSNSPYKRKLIIHSKFPRDAVVKALKPILRYYFDAYYSLNKSKRSIGIAKWRTKLENFVNNNPQFGRRIIDRHTTMDISGSTKTNNKVVFVTEVNEIQENLFHDFMNDHLVPYTDDVDIISFRNLLLQSDTISRINSGNNDIEFIFES